MRSNAEQARAPWYGDGVAKRARKPPSSSGLRAPAGPVVGPARRHGPRDRPHRPRPDRPRRRRRPRASTSTPPAIVGDGLSGLFGALVGLARYLVPIGLIVGGVALVHDGQLRAPPPHRPRDRPGGVGLLILLHVARRPHELPGRLLRRGEGRRLARGQPSASRCGASSGRRRRVVLAHRPAGRRRRHHHPVVAEARRHARPPAACAPASVRRSAPPGRAIKEMTTLSSDKTAGADDADDADEPPAEAPATPLRGRRRRPAAALRRRHRGARRPHGSAGPATDAPPAPRPERGHRRRPAADGPRARAGPVDGSCPRPTCSCARSPRRSTARPSRSGAGCWRRRSRPTAWRPAWSA